MCRLNAIPIKIRASYFMDIDKWILKLIWRGRRSRIANLILEDKNKVGGLILLNLKSYCKATVTTVTTLKTVWCW